MANRAVNENSVKNAALTGESTIAEGLEWWPISMRHWGEWERCRNVLLARQAKFPVSCISLPFLSALAFLDIASIDATGIAQGLISSVLQMMRLALRMNEDSVKDGRIRAIFNDRELSGVFIQQKDGEEKLITPVAFDEVRRVLVWQQGEDLPDESLNDELLETEQDLAERNRPKLKYSMHSLISSVALACHARPQDLLDWPIIEFDSMRKAIDRSKKHELCAIAESNGAKWKGGNPYPSWCFDRDEQVSNALVSASDFGKAKKR